MKKAIVCLAAITLLALAGCRSTVAGVAVVARGNGWTASGLEGPVPGPAACHYRRAADGFLLPDPACTPGAVNASVSVTALCRSGPARPPLRLTEPFKDAVEHAYHDPYPTSRTELDHLIPLELGGASDTRNLWPEPDQGSPAQFDPSDPYGSNAKDGVEDRLHTAVCAGRVDLAAVQAAIATDWTTALVRLGLSAQPGGADDGETVE
ncbi:MAG TPA: hypothetical protein VGL49_07425 [Acidimicrobiales bacterium]|jgi:hypothetical protein